MNESCIVTEKLEVLLTKYLHCLSLYPISLDAMVDSHLFADNELP